ncbi:Uncharacterised protein [Mycobacteroides abscessus subsp. abscessus]|nr:Uncharacterised protein [Mycobacteroides abscessus subsp. abscessus]
MITLRPLCEDSDTFLPSASSRVNAGALSPTSSRLVSAMTGAFLLTRTVVALG